MDLADEPPRIAGPVREPKRPRQLDWTPDEKTRRQILVDTPARLFGT
jgi:hypothetical protein